MQFSIAGLASNFDWKSFVDQIISLEGAGVNRLRTEQATNNSRGSALSTLNTRLETLRTAANDLGATNTFGGRTARLAASNTTWSTSAAAGATAGTYAFNVTQTATAARQRGVADIGRSLAPTSDVSGLVLGTLDTAVPPTAGEFTINGARVNVTLADTLQDVFTKIATATGGQVTGSYDPGTDRVALTAATGAIALGAANDTSNLLGALRLANPTPASNIVNSGGPLGTTDTAVPLTSARLRAAITAVDGTGAGSFAVNGVNIAYNVNTDSLATVLGRITDSAAGVGATYDAVGDRVILTNKVTGDLGVALQEGAGGLLGALGLATAGGDLTRGQNALFTINGGDVLTSTSNTLTSASHGITGLTVGVTGAGADTVTVASDTSGMRAKIDTFIKSFNDVQSYLETQTRVTSANGRVTSALLAGNREVQNWGSSLRQQVFATVPGLSGALSRLSDLGVDFTGVEAQLSVRDSAKLEQALANRPAEVAEFFSRAGTGFATRLDSYVDSLLGGTGVGADNGLLGKQRQNLTKANESLDTQIATLQRQLEQRRAQLETGFIAYESATQRINQMQQQLNSALGTNSRS
jgi:flagellar hook-associated protein 2